MRSLPYVAVAEPLTRRSGWKTTLITAVTWAANRSLLNFTLCLSFQRLSFPLLFLPQVMIEGNASPFFCS